MSPEPYQRLLAFIPVLVIELLPGGRPRAASSIAFDVVRALPRIARIGVRDWVVPLRLQLLVIVACFKVVPHNLVLAVVMYLPMYSLFLSHPLEILLVAF